MKEQQNIFLSFAFDKKWRILRHVVSLFLLYLILNPDVESFPRVAKFADGKIFIRALYKHSFAMFITAVTVIYINLYIIIPNVLFKGKYILYFFIFMVQALTYFFIAYFNAYYFLEEFGKYINLPTFSISSIVDYLLAPIAYLGATTGYKIFKKWIIDNERLNALKNSQLKEELNQLKNQVNPHFLFNTLNNLDTLIQTNSEKASQVVYGLSDVLRYQIYESNREFILLSKDVDVLAQFLLLEKIRRDRFNYEILIDTDIEGVLVPPLLFINFIDNAIKHSLDNRNPSYLKIKFNIHQNRLYFEAENSKPSFIVQKETGGFGLRNIQRRLDLLYEKNYQLILTDEPNKYMVRLNIPL